MINGSVALPSIVYYRVALVKPPSSFLLISETVYKKSVTPAPALIAQRVY